MKSHICYCAVDGTLGVVRNRSNTAGERPPELVMGPPCELRLRLFANCEDATPFPLAQVADVCSWSFEMDTDFSSSSPVKLAARNSDIRIAEVTENGVTHTEITIPLPETHTTELAAALDGKEYIVLAGELIGYDSDRAEAFVLQIKGFTVRGRVRGLGEPTPVSATSHETQIPASGFAPRQTEVVSGGSVGYIPVVSGGMCYRFTDPLATLSVGSITSSLDETDILFTAGASVTPPVSVGIRYQVGEQYDYDDDEGDISVPVYSTLVLSGSGTGYVCNVPASRGWYSAYDEDNDETKIGYLSAGSFTCASAGGKWIASAHNVTEVMTAGGESSSRVLNTWIASSTDGMATWTFNSAAGTALYAAWWDDYDWGMHEDSFFASAITASATVTPCDVVLPSGALLVNSSVVTVESGHRYEMNVKHGAIVTAEWMEASDE